MLLQQWREVRTVILSITPWLPTYMGQSLIRCNKLYDKAAEDGALEGCITALVTYKDGMLFRKGKVWIPSDPSLRKLIMESEHDSRVAGHVGMDKTMELDDRNFYWPEMAKDIEDYVRSCEDCLKNKAS